MELRQKIFFTISILLLMFVLLANYFLVPVVFDYYDKEIEIRNRNSKIEIKNHLTELEKTLERMAILFSNDYLTNIVEGKSLTINEHKDETIRLLESNDFDWNIEIGLYNNNGVIFNGTDNDIIRTIDEYSIKRAESEKVYSQVVKIYPKTYYYSVLPIKVDGEKIYGALYFHMDDTFWEDLRFKTGIEFILNYREKNEYRTFEIDKDIDFEKELGKDIIINGKKYQIQKTYVKYIGNIYFLVDINYIDKERNDSAKTYQTFFILFIIFFGLVAYYVAKHLTKPIDQLKKETEKLIENRGRGTISEQLVARIDEIGALAKLIQEVEIIVKEDEQKVEKEEFRDEKEYKELKNLVYILELKNKDLNEKLKGLELAKQVFKEGIKDREDLTGFLKYMLETIYKYRKYKRAEMIYQNTLDKSYEKLVYIPEKDKVIEKTYNETLRYLIAERPIIRESYLELPIKIKGKIVGNLKIDGIDMSFDTEKVIELVINESEVIMENSELYNTMDKRLLDLSFLNSITAALSSASSINVMKGMISDAMTVLFGLKTEIAYIYESGFFLDFRERRGQLIKIKQKRIDDTGPFLLNKDSVVTYRGEKYLPIVSKEKLLGAIKLSDNIDVEKLDQNILKIFITQVAIIFQNSLMYIENKKRGFAIIASLAEAIEEKDYYTRGHADRVTTYSVKIAEKMKLPQDEVEKIRYAGILHDVGKIGIPEKILTKPGRLTDEEFDIIKQHPEKGAKILSHIIKFEEIIEIVKYHHERPDGKGYPEGLQGNKIPLAARILAIADTFDAMTTDRTYRKGLSIDIVVEEVKKYRGMQFDEKVADVFLEMIKAKQIVVLRDEK